MALHEREVDCGALYEEKRRDFVALARSLSPEQLAMTVPATPLWSVQDVMAHVIGITADLNAQEFWHVGGPDAWTAAQVQSRRGQPVDELVDEWDAEAPQFVEGLRILGYEIGSHYVGDLLLHLIDVQHALELPVRRNEPAVVVSLDFYVSSFEEALEGVGVGAVEITAGHDTWTVGFGDVVARIRGDAFDLLRALGGRRTEDQIRAMDWEGDIDAVLSVVSRYPLPAEAVDP